MKAVRKNTSITTFYQKVVILLAALVFLAMLTFLGILYDRFYQYRLDSNAAIESLQTQVAEMAGSMSLSRVAVVPSDDAVYIPELRIKLPINQTTLSLMYSVRSVTEQDTVKQEADISTVAEEAYVPTTPQRLACQPVRLAFEAKANAYNPHETPQQAVKLADGRTLQIYAFHEDSCTAHWKYTGVDSDKIAQVFQQAKSY